MRRTARRPPRGTEHLRLNELTVHLLTIVCAKQLGFEPIRVCKSIHCGVNSFHTEYPKNAKMRFRTAIRLPTGAQPAAPPNAIRNRAASNGVCKMYYNIILRHCQGKTKFFWNFRKKYLIFSGLYDIIVKVIGKRGKTACRQRLKRGVAQVGRALRSGRRGRGFESRRLDQLNKKCPA